MLDNPTALYKIVVPGDNILVYTGFGDKANEIVFSSAAPQIPAVENNPVDYNYPITFDSPHLNSAYKSGNIRIQYSGEMIKLDFSQIRRDRGYINSHHTET